MIDGGLATELEERGHDLNDPLWSARLLTTHPEEIQRVHRTYLEAGADCLITASYQASVPGIMAHGVSEEDAKAIILKSVTLACDARDSFLEIYRDNGRSRLRPIVAASIGPYGAALADGSEYRGNYGVSDSDLRDFHKPRWEVLVKSGADLLACETIPSLQEAKVLQCLLHEHPEVRTWMSFSCKDGRHISDGTPLAECASLFNHDEQVIAVGINCTAPQYIASLIEQVRLGAPSRPIVVYPNSGEVYDGKKRVWTGYSNSSEFGEAAVQWLRCGASLIGGCCRTGPQHIRAMREMLLQSKQ